MLNMSKKDKNKKGIRNRAVLGDEVTLSEGA